MAVFAVEAVLVVSTATVHQTGLWSIALYVSQMYWSWSPTECVGHYDSKT